jgi:hypothetical protein
MQTPFCDAAVAKSTVLSQHRFCLPSLGVQHRLLSAARIAAHPSAGQEAVKNRDTQAIHLLHIIPRQRSQQCLVSLHGVIFLSVNFPKSY